MESKDHVPHALTGNDLVSDTHNHAHVAPGSPPGSGPKADIPVDPDAGSWSSVVFIVALFVLLYFLKFNMLAILKTVLGLAFVVFIHELGHFLAAKWCDVNVTTFSIGFGPAIWARKWGETIYQLAAIPLGGYVQMVGQVDGDEAADGSDNDPRSFRNKGVGQRMLIISAGVIMNVILAIVAYVLVFMVPGKMRNPAIVAWVDSGGPAFVEGLRTGDVIKKVGSISDPYFEDLKFVVALSQAGDVIPFEAMQPGDTIRTMKMEPRRNEEDSNPVIGVAPPKQLKLYPKWFVDPTMKSPNEKGSPADVAGFEFGDEIIGTTDPDDPAKVKGLPLDTRDPSNLTRDDYFEFQRRMQLLADKDVVIQVRRDGKEVDLKVKPAWKSSLGIRMGMDQIVALRKESPATKAELQIPATVDGKSREGDRIDRVMVVGGDKKVLVFDSNPKAPAKEKVAEWLGVGADKVGEIQHRPLDPDRLPDQLKRWARSVDSKKAAKTVYLGIRRHRDQPGQQYDDLVKRLEWDDAWTFDRQLATTKLSPQAIPELGLAYQVTTGVESTDPAFKDHPLKAGDIILNAKLHTEEAKDGGSWISPNKDFSEKHWAHVYFALSGLNLKNVTKITLKLKGDKEPRTVELTPMEDEFASIERGWGLMDDSRVQKADSIGEAITMGFTDTNKSVLQVFLGIRGMVTNRINFLKNIGGPLSIARISYGVAGFNTWEFVFFLGMISINLAVINFLPVPVLDGGHMVFLIYEKIRGKPATEGVRVAMTYIGLALILSLMIFVLAIDFSKFFM